MNVIEAIKDVLVAQNVGKFGSSPPVSNTDWRIFLHHQPVSPDRAITLYATGGSAPNPRWRMDYPSIQVCCRAEQNNPNGAYNKAVEVQNALLGISYFDVANYGRINSVAMAGGIVKLGPDENGRVPFVVNLNLITEPTATDQRDQLP